MVATGSFWLLHEGSGYEKLVAPVHRKLQDAEEVVKFIFFLFQKLFGVFCSLMTLTGETTKDTHLLFYILNNRSDCNCDDRIKIFIIQNLFFG